MTNPLTPADRAALREAAKRYVRDLDSRDPQDPHGSGRDPMASIAYTHATRKPRDLLALLDALDEAEAALRGVVDAGMEWHYTLERYAPAIARAREARHA